MLSLTSPRSNIPYSGILDLTKVEYTTFRYIGPDQGRIYHIPVYWTIPRSNIQHSGIFDLTKKFRRKARPVYCQFCIQIFVLVKFRITRISLDPPLVPFNQCISAARGFMICFRKVETWVINVGNKFRILMFTHSITLF